MLKVMQHLDAESCSPFTASNLELHPHAGINGIGLSMVIPSGQSMVADYYPEERRGAAFGALYLTGALGAMLGAS